MFTHNKLKSLIYVLFLFQHHCKGAEELIDQQRYVDCFAKTIKENKIDDIQNLLKYEAYQNILNEPDMFARTPLMNACCYASLQMVKLLLQEPTINIDAAIINEKNLIWLQEFTGFTALSFTVRHWHKNPQDSNQTIQLLLSRRAKKTRWNPLKQERTSVIWDLPLQLDGTQVPPNMTQDQAELFTELQTILFESNNDEKN